MTQLLVQAAAASLVIAALLFARRALRRRDGSGSGPGLVLGERGALGRDSGVAVVTWHGRELLVGYAPSGITLLAEASREPTP